MNPDTDKVFKALADRTRRYLLDRLHEDNGQTLGELCERLEMSRQATTQHLAVLEAANLVSTVRRGREKLHYLNPVPLHRIQERWIDKFERPRLRSLSALKQRAEDAMTVKPEFVYVVYIESTPRRSGTRSPTPTPQVPTGATATSPTGRPAPPGSTAARTARASPTSSAMSWRAAAAPPRHHLGGSRRRTGRRTVHGHLRHRAASADRPAHRHPREPEGRGRTRRGRLRLGRGPLQPQVVPGDRPAPPAGAVALPDGVTRGGRTWCRRAATRPARGRSGRLRGCAVPLRRDRSAGRRG